MGIGLVKAAFEAAAEGELRDHAPVRLYVYMATMALDGDEAPAYFGGIDRLVRAIAAPEGPTGKRAVKRALAVLTSRGFVRLSNRPAPGRGGRYLLLDGARATLTPNGGRSPSPVERTGDAERAVNNPQRGTLSGRTGDAERPERGTLSGLLRRKGGTTEEEGTTPPPTRTCTQHADWNHDRPCRACGNDRQTAERHQAEASERRNRMIAAAPPALTALTAAERAQVDSAVRGVGSVPERLQSALREAMTEREQLQ